MANLNKVMLIGNLTRDPDLRHTPKGTSVVEISLAINRVWMNEAAQKQEDVTFVEAIFWGRQADTIHTHLAKGDPIYLEGRLQLDTWDDKETGKKRSKLRVIGESFQFLKSGKRDGDKPPTSYLDDRLDQEAAAKTTRSASTGAADPEEFEAPPF